MIAKLYFFVLVAFFVVGSSVAQDQLDSRSTAATQQQTRRSASESTTLEDGIYLVLRWTETKQDLQPLFSEERLLRHDPNLLANTAGEPIVHLTVNDKDRVLLAELRQLDPVKQQDGRTQLKLTLSESSTRKLEQLTRRHLGRQVAVVVGGSAVTMHKIRSVISDGKFRITRCTDDGCEVILSKLGELEERPE